MPKKVKRKKGRVIWVVTYPDGCEKVLSSSKYNKYYN
jgi:hypothetical protein